MTPADAPTQSPAVVERVLRGIERFCFAPARAAPFAVLRIGLAAVLLAQALQIAPVFHALYHHGGLLRGSLMDSFGPNHLPALGRVLSALAGRGVAESAVLSTCGVLYLGSLLGLLLGWRTRFVTVAAWLLHLFFMMLAPYTTYGADDFANIFLFYSMFAPLGAASSLDHRSGRTADAPSATNRLALRVMQVHLCIAYLFSGVQKALGEQWWTGEAIWRSLMVHGYQLFDFTWLAHCPALAAIVGWLVLVIEIGYPVCIWPRRTRRPWIAAVVGLHAGIAVFMGLHVFGALMIVLTVAMFGVSAEPEAGGRSGARRGTPTRPPVQGRSVRVGSWPGVKVQPPAPTGQS